MPHILTNNFDLWAAAVLDHASTRHGSNGNQQAYGVQKLRELILELAVRGRLVPQDANDEPASELLRKTVAEKQRLVAKGLLRDSKPPVAPIEPPDHLLPRSWVWTSLSKLGEIAPRNAADDSAHSSFVPMQAISEKYGVSVRHEVRPWGEIRSGFTHFREEDVVVAKITPCFQNGKSAVMRGLTNGLGAGTTELHVYRSIGACTVPEYVLIYLKSPRFISDGIPKMTGTAGQKRITRDYFAGNHFPLPPLAEQHRIVAKVDELMALCDRLEQQQLQSIESHHTLVETLLGALTRVPSQQELTATWSRIAKHFDTLFTSEHSIDELKQTILELAVTGNLVPQETNDEPAAELLNEIAATRKKLVHKGLIREEKPTAILRAEVSSLPRGWKVVRFGELISLISGQHLNPQEYSSLAGEGRIPYLTGPAEFGELVPVPTRYTSETRALAEAGDVLITCKGSGVGKTNIADRQIAISRQLMAIRPIVLSTDFVKLVADSLEEAIRERIVGIAIPGISREDVRDAIVLLPPLGEQRRIVTKFEELMSLCDALKGRIAEGQRMQIHLADAVVRQAIA